MTNQEFAKRLIEIARVYGWSGDYIEISEFVLYVANRCGVPTTHDDVQPYEFETDAELDAFEDKTFNEVNHEAERTGECPNAGSCAESCAKLPEAAGRGGLLGGQLTRGSGC